MLNGKEGMECEDCIVRMQLERVSEFKGLGCILNESGTDDAECHRKVSRERKAASPIRSLVNAEGLQLECAWVLHEELLVPVLMYGSETTIWKEKERSKIGVVQMDNLRGLLGIWRMDKAPNAQIKE